MRARIIGAGVIMATAAAAPLWAQVPGHAGGRVDPHDVAGWLPPLDPWQSYTAMPGSAYCLLLVVDGRVAGARRDDWAEGGYPGHSTERDRYDDERWYEAQRSEARRALPGVVVAGRCVPYVDYVALYRPWLGSHSLADLAALERARVRLRRDAYPIGPHGEDPRFGDPYSGTPDPYPQEHRLRATLEGRSSGADPTAVAEPERQACVVVTARTASGRAVRVRLALPVLGSDTPEAVADAIERTLARGESINQVGLDGLALRLSAHDALDRLVVSACTW